MRYKPRSIMLLSMLVVLAVGVYTSAASAAVQFEWKVGGAALASGSSKGFTSTIKSGSLFHLKVTFGGLLQEFTSSKIKFSSTSSILGGKPGTGEGVLELEGVKVAHPVNCSVTGEKITSVPLKAEIVESSEKGLGRGATEILFVSKAGGTEAQFFSNFHVEGEACSLKGQTYGIFGDVLAEIGPQKAEAQVDHLVFEAKHGEGEKYAKPEYRNSKGTITTAGLTYATNPALLTGEAEMELASKGVFGAF